MKARAFATRWASRLSDHSTGQLPDFRALQRPLRISVVGCPGSGKSTLARRLVAQLGSTHIELDAHFWRPNWEESDKAEFRRRIDALLDGAGEWVTDGNFNSSVQDLIRSRANLVIWLDYSFTHTFWWALRRTARRAFSQELLWGTNRESVRKALSRDGILWWIIQMYDHYREIYLRELCNPRDGLAIARITRISELQAFETGFADLCGRSAG